MERENKVSPPTSRTSFFEWLQNLLALSLAGLVLSPILESGYYGDDSLQSLTHGFLAINSRTVFEQYLFNIEHFAPHRLSILQLFHWVFVIIRDLEIYKFYCFSLVMFNLIIFSRLIKEITGSSRLATYAILLPTVFFQFREYGDPILVFHGVSQINCLTFMIALLLFIKHLRAPSPKLLFVALLLYFISLNTYEYSYPLSMVFPCLSWLVATRSSLWLRLRPAFPFVFLAAGMAALVFIVRHFNAELSPEMATTYKQAYTPQFEALPYLKSVLAQLFATLPLSYWFTNPHKVFSYPLFLEFLQVGPSLLISALFYFAVRQSKDTPVIARPQTNLPVLLIVGFALLVAPSILIALSPIYRRDIVMGSSYTGVYMSCFGITCLALALIQKIKNRATLMLSACLTSVLLIINLTNNHIVVEHLNSFWHYPRNILEAGIRSQIFDQVPQKSYLFTNNDYPWDVSALYRDRLDLTLGQGIYEGAKGHFFASEFNGLKLQPLSKQEIANVLQSRGGPVLKNYFKHSINDTMSFEFPAETRPAWYLDYYSDSVENGFVILAPIHHLQASNSTITGATSATAKIYVRTPRMAGAARSLSVSGFLINNRDQNERRYFILNEYDLTLLNAGMGEKLFSVQSPLRDWGLDLKSLQISNISKTIQTSTFFREKDPSIYKLGSGQKSDFQIGFLNSFSGAEFSLPPFSLGDNFTLELLIRPLKGQSQAPYAHIIGNHPGPSGFDGFVIQQEGVSQNIYRASFGNGHSWASPAIINLPDGELSHLVLVGVGQTISTFLNGKLVAEGPIETKKESSAPLYVGNFVDGRRPFRGDIEEIRISKTPMSRTEILKRWQRVRQ